MKKDDREIMEILEAFDLTRCAHSAARLVGCDPKTVRTWVDRRDRGLPVGGAGRRERLIDPFADKVEEWVDRSKGHVRADVVHERLVAVGFAGDERTTRRAVAEAKTRWRAGRRRTYRPWITEPGMWCQFDWGVGPAVPFAGGPPRATLLFCLWLAWSRFRVVIPTWDRTLPTLLSCIDTSLRRLGGAPTYALTDNEKTVTVEHIAHVAVRHPEVVAAGRHYGMQVATCVSFDPESKGGSEATVRIAKADLVPTEANLLDAYPDMSALVAACDSFCAQVNSRRHRETGAVPAERLITERERLHVLPSAPYAAALGETRLVNTDQTIRFGSVRYSTPPGLVGAEVWVRAAGDELVIVADLNALPLRPGWSARRCGSAQPGTSWSSSPTWARWRCVQPGRRRHRRAWLRSPATPCPRRGARGSSCPTTPATHKIRPGSAAADSQAHQPGGDRVPRARSRRGGLAGRGRRRGRDPGAGEDGRRGRARRAGRAGRGRCRARRGRGRRPVPAALRPDTLGTTRAEPSP